MEDLHGSAPGAEARFRATYADAYADVLRFVTRRVPPSQAEDVVADVFVVVWRRLRDMPPARSEARAWIFGIARLVILNTTRGDRRRAALEIRLVDPTVLSPLVGTDPEVVARRVDLGRAWPRLAASDQEALALAYWEHLSSPEAAAILGISPVAFRLRLTRARRHLRRLLDVLEPAPPMPFPISEGSSS
jgi:RNA polymerase sigma-70 factor, ECF subfamily